MELEVVERGGVDVPVVALHPLVDVAEPRKIVAGRPLRRDTGDVDLEERPDLVHLLEVHRLTTEKEPDRLADSRGVDRGDAKPTPRADLDHAFRHERAHRLADDRPGDSELLAELAFGGKLVSDVEPIREDRLEHHVGDLVRQARLAHDLPEEGRGDSPALASFTGAS